jgi:Core-2/I-Branching enzyme
MRICYFIQNHLGPPQVKRLVETLRRGQPESFILVGHDGFSGHCTADGLRQAVDVDVFETREPARRGYFSLIQPYLDALDWLEEHRIDYDWIVYLSAQDYPTRPLQQFESFLAASSCDGFLRYWDARDAAPSWGRRRLGLRRYFYQYRDAPGWMVPGALRLLRSLNGMQSAMHVHLVYGPRVGVRKPTPFGPDLTCYAGTLWTTLSRACAEHVRESMRREPVLIEWFRHTICPCEAIVQTLLVNSGRFQLCNDDLRYAEFIGNKDGRPRTLSVMDLPVITNGSYYFARKFDPQRDPELLDLLDGRIG